ncbi:hypothetical protein HPB51_020363 [Rhipicephalus microplus]|uniref:Uncharacterized protein n=1 Tax=Rhipicephalus microplus TaxID=6941 RepID=A0A9J6DVW4_RHIMP|nr:hypothetical protein HPB51_020363 [Rhipicephalus microplus]
MPPCMQVLGDTLYWTDWQLRAVLSCSKQTGAHKRTVLVGELDPMDIQAYSALRQPKVTLKKNAGEGFADHGNGFVDPHLRTTAVEHGAHFYLSRSDMKFGSERKVLELQQSCGPGAAVIEAKRVTVEDAADHAW